LQRQEISKSGRTGSHLRTAQGQGQKAAVSHLMDAFDLAHGFLRDLENRITFWCRGSERMYGFTKEQAIGRISHELLRTRFPKPLSEIEAELLQNGCWQGELSHRASSGALLHVASSWALQYNPQGEPMSVLEVHNDITERLNAHYASTRLAAIVHDSDDAIIGLGLDGNITIWNASAEKLFGYSASEMVGLPIYQIVPREGLAEYQQLLARIARGEPANHVETVQLTKTHQRLYVSLTISPIRNAEGQIVGISKITRDMTARRKMENALRRSNQALEQFAYAAAHDLQEPLRNISLALQYAEATQTPPFSSGTQTFIDLAIENAKRMQSMVDDLLAFSRALTMVDLDAAGFRTDTEDVLKTVLKNLDSAIVESGAVITYDELPSAAISEIHLLQIFQNIISNAIKYRDADPPKIHIACHSMDSELSFAISDEGIGIPQEFQERVFGVFQRLGFRNASGTGIGLALCKRIIEHYGGSIRIKTNLTKGVTVLFTLPACPEN
jgi:PAS domain S-box-containing protein